MSPGRQLGSKQPRKPNSNSYINQHKTARIQLIIDSFFHIAPTSNLEQTGKKKPYIHHKSVMYTAPLLVNPPKTSPCQSPPVKAYVIPSLFHQEASPLPCLPSSLCQTQMIVVDSLVTASSE